VSWPLATFAIVFGVLIAGWLAYERSRPSARMTAVVGTLAAVAALGRDAFVALPDVKPITAMTFVVGYALGPLPGFAVGAVGMLASNIVLGQGPYTPWQMAAWGLVGLAGAGLGRLSGRHMGRVGIALACGVSALGAKEVMNVYTWTLGASHTPAALAAAAGAALPFDVTDVIASFLFGLAFGPELARLLGRMRARMTVRWEPTHPPTATPLVLLAVCLIGASTAHAGTSHEVTFLEGAQNADGGFGAAKGQRSSELYSAWAAVGLAAAGRDPCALTRDGHTVLNSIDGEASTLQGAGDLERTILALRACGASTRKLAGSDPVARLLRFRAGDGSFGRLVNLTAFAVLALRAAGEPAGATVVRAAARWLARQQNPDGGFSYAARGAASDIDDTAAALQGVVAASVPAGPVVSQAVAYLEHVQNPDGGYPLQPGGESNAQSTAWAVQGLLAAGRDPSAVVRGGRSPLGYLEGLVASDGSVRYSSTSSQTPVWVTSEALAALAGKPFPIAPAPEAPVSPARSGIAPARTRAVAHVHPRAGRGGHAVNSIVAPGLLTGQRRLDALARRAGMLVGILLAPVLSRKQ
jgi:energy-coupling factor transport system substrate-specific component